MRALILPLLLGAAPSPADRTSRFPAPVVAAAEEAPAPLPGERLAFADMDNRMTVPVHIGAAGPYRFVIDTGAQRTVVSRELAGSLGLAQGRRVHLIDMAGAGAESTVMVPSISVSTLGGSDIEAPALAGIDLGAAGMLGIDALQGHVVSIDFATRTMTVAPSTRRLRSEPALPGEIVVRARNLFGQLIVTDAWCDGRRVKVVLDTGSAVSMGNLALQRRFARRDGAPERILLTSVTGRQMTASYTTIQHIRIGEMSIERLPIAFADAPPFRQFGLADTPAILLGMDALRLFRRVRIDFANKEVRLAPPAEAAPARREDWRSMPLG